MTFHKSILFTFLSFMLFAKTHAQTEDATPKRNQIGIQLGLEQTYFKDINFSPVNYQANGPAVDLHYLRRTRGDDIIYAQLNFSSTTLRSDNSIYFESDRILGGVALAYLKKLSLGNDKLRVYAGGQIQTFLDFVSFREAEAVTFYSQHSFDLTGRLAYDFNDKHHLSTSLSLPVLGLLVRPPYTGWGWFFVEREDKVLGIFLRGKWTSIHDFFAINWQTSYSYNLSSRWDFVAAYQFQYHRTNHLKPIRIATSQLRLGTNFKF